MRRLKAQPELRTRPEAGRKQQRCLRRNASLAADDLVHSLKRDPELTRKLELGGAKRPQELLQKNLTRVRRNPIARQHDASLSVVVGDADSSSVSVFPSKNNPPLIVDPNAAEPLQRTL